MCEEHTPGPWKVSNTCGMIFGRSVGGCNMEESDFMVAQVRGWGHLQYLGEEKAIAIQEANARLIAAAPETKNSHDDLLAACEYTKTLLADGVGQHTHALALIEAAIAQAEKG